MDEPEKIDLKDLERIEEFKDDINHLSEIPTPAIKKALDFLEEYAKENNLF